MPWIRLDSDYASDGRIRRARAVQWWPLILCAMKRGGGVASDDDITPEVLADIGQGAEDAAAKAVAGLKSSGVLIPADGGWTTPNWSVFQPDPTGSDRQRRWRERNARAAAVANEGVTVRNGDITSRNGAKRSVTPDGTYGTVQDIQTAVAADAPAPAHAREDSNFEAVERIYLDATGGGLMVRNVEAVALKALTDTHGPDAVIAAIKEAVLANTRDRVSVNFVRAILEKRGQGCGTSLIAPRRPNEFRNATPTEMRRLEGDEF